MIYCTVMSHFYTFSLIALTALFLGQVSVAQAAGTTTAATTTTAIATSTAAHNASTTVITTNPIIQNRTVVEKKVREVFADAPIMIDVARCESSFRQFTDSGAPFRGGAGGAMVGVFQFYEKAHAPFARTLGFDLTTLEGNIGYARNVYEHQGTTPWKACVPATTSAIDAQTKLKIELLTKLVLLLQELLKLQLAAA